MSIRVMTEFFGLRFGSANRKAVAVRLADHADDGGRGIWPAVASVAEDCELSCRTVQRILDEFVSEGILVVVRKGGGGPGQTTRYDFDLARVRARTAEIAEAQGKGDTVSPMAEDAEKGDNGAPKGDTDDEKGCHRVTQTVIEPSEPSQGAREAARESFGGKADFQKRVQRFCNGSGFLAGPWKGWDQASFGWIAKQFAALSEAEQIDAERWRDAYLLDIADRKANPQPVGVFLRDKAWAAMDPALLERLDRRKQALLAPEERAQPEGWAACLGPVGMAHLFATLISGPPSGVLLADRVWLENQIRQDWPAVHQWKALQMARRGVVFGPRWHALKPAMEAVPAGTVMLAAWKAEFARRGWPWLSSFDAAPVLWAPKGGPEGLSEFEAKVRGHDGGGREAAE